MTRIGTWTAAGALLALAACQGTQMGGDAGPTDLPTDAGSADGGPTDLPTDAGPSDAGAQVCSLSTGERIPELCLPRCTAETEECIAGCGDDDACSDACAASDATPPMMADLNGQTLSLDCTWCVQWPGLVCARDLCPVEFEACASCDAGFCSESDCQPAWEEVVTCVGDHAAAYLTCIGAERAACFP